MKTELIPLITYFINYAFEFSIGNLKEWGAELQRHKIHQKQETSLPWNYAQETSMKERSISYQVQV